MVWITNRAKLTTLFGATPDMLVADWVASAQVLQSGVCPAVA